LEEYLSDDNQEWGGGDFSPEGDYDERIQQEILSYQPPEPIHRGESVDSWLTASPHQSGALVLRGELH